MNQGWSSVLLASIVSSTIQANDNTILKNFDPGFQLNQTLQMQLYRQLVQKPEEQEQVVQKPDSNTEQSIENDDITFFVKQIKVNTSQIIPEQELNRLIQLYEQKILSMQQLYQLITQINEKYAKQQCVVCRAFLLEQQINDGVVEIQLIEGKTGQVHIEGNNHLKGNYIIKRLPSLVQGQVARLDELNRDLQWFNSSEDTHLTVTLQPGEHPYTTDYVVQAKEPTRDELWLSADSQGYEATGKYRLSAAYLLRNITGYGDKIDLNSTLSEGHYGFAINYMQPIMSNGLKLMLGHSSNALEAVQGVAKEINLEGYSSSTHIGFVKPLVIENTWKLQGQLEYRQLRSETEILQQDWINDTINTYHLGFNGHYLFDQSFLNFASSLSYGKWKDITQHVLDFSTLHLNLMYSLPLNPKNTLQMRLNLQKSFNDNTPSSSKFSATGYYATRGYDEGNFSSLSGGNLNLDYIYVLNHTLSMKLFSDLGWLDVSDDKLLMSVGTELEWQPIKNTYFALQFATPIIREVSDTKADAYTLHFKLYKTF